MISCTFDPPELHFLRDDPVKSLTIRNTAQGGMLFWKIPQIFLDTERLDIGTDDEGNDDSTSGELGPGHSVTILVGTNDNTSNANDQGPSSIPINLTYLHNVTTIEIPVFYLYPPPIV